KTLGARQIARCQRRPYRRAGNTLAVHLYGVHRLDGKTMRRARLLQQGEIAAATLAETKVVADQQMAHAKTTYQHLFDELVRREASQARIEATDIDLIHPALRQQGELFTQTR